MAQKQAKKPRCEIRSEAGKEGWASLGQFGPAWASLGRLGQLELPTELLWCADWLAALVGVAQHGPTWLSMAPQAHWPWG